MSNIYCIVPVFHKVEFKKLFAAIPENIRLIVLDNTMENIGIPKRYNEFIVSLQKEEDAWCIFCHDDLEFLDWGFISLLTSYPKDMLLGPLGARDNNTRKQLITFTDVANNKYRRIQVETLDCMCLICHASIFRRGIRFDERLQWHLYVEDFCISAKINHNINSFVIPINYYHHSDGQVNLEYLRHQQYISKKYHETQNWGTCGMIGKRIGQKQTLLQAANRLIWEIWVAVSRQ